MEDILASIRRILSEDETAEPPEADPVPAEDDVLVLDASMIDDDVMAAEPPEPEMELELEPQPEPEPGPTPVPVPIVPQAAPPPPPPPVATPTPVNTDLLGPAAAAAAASSVDSLLRTLAAERTSQVHRGGPTIEDLVREEVRPLLKEWLDTHLPPMVERLVRAEIERVTGRAAP